MTLKEYLICFLFFLLMFVIFIYSYVPNDDDFVNWFQENFDVQCDDPHCNIIYLGSYSSSTEDNMFSNSGGYSWSGFLGMSRDFKRLYKSLQDPNILFTIEARGFLGRIKLLEIYDPDNLLNN